MLTADIAARLVTDGFATAVGTDVFENLNPDDHPTSSKRVDNCIMVNEYQGAAPYKSFGALIREDARFQIMVRNTVYATGLASVNSIFKGWYKKTFTAGAVDYYIEALDSPRFLMRDKGPVSNVPRTWFVCNFRAVKQPS